MLDPVGFLVSWFADPSLLGIGLAVAFGAIWLTCYWPPLFKRFWLWLVLVAGAILTLLAISFIQIPLQLIVGQVLNQFWSQEVLARWLLLSGIPAVLFSGLVQEGAKLVPVIVWWRRSGGSLDPRLGLFIGAVAGAGFGVFEAQWVHKSVLVSSVCGLEAIQFFDIDILAGLWERFVTVAFHTAVSALAGYGLARGWGWQFYLLASFLHAFLNYGVILLQSGLFTIMQSEIFIAVVAVMVTVGVLYLRWRSSEVVPEA